SRHTRDRARADADGVVDELLPERNLQLDQSDLPRLPPDAWHRDEAVEIRGSAAARVVVDRVAAAEEPGHDGLCDARGEAGSHGCIGGGPALLEDLSSRIGGRGMARCNSGSHARNVKPVPILGRMRVLVSSTALVGFALVL